MAENEIKVRRLQFGDEEAILEIDYRIVGPDRAPTWHQQVRRYLDRYYPPVSHVAISGEQIVGFILGDVRGWEYGLPSAAWIDIMGVDPNYQHRGVGRMLVEAFMEQCKQQGIDEVHAFMREGDDMVSGFFGSLGFGKGPLMHLVRKVD